MKSSLYRTGLGLSTLLLYAAACASLLDINEAETDPLLLGTGGSVGGNGGTGGTATGLCPEYCQTVQAECTDENAVYVDETTCLAYCESLPEGMPDDQAGNTVGCRLFNANAARTTGEQDVHCPIAGPGGEGTCGTNCEAYCTVLQQVCDTRFAMDFDGVTDCLMQCNDSVPDDGNYNSGITEGDSIQCRMYHLSAASVLKSPHCSHAAGDAPCVDMAAGGAGGAGGGAGGTGGAGGMGGSGGN